MSYNSKLQKCALWYARHGLPVFPCKPKSKKPATAHGFKDATTDAAQVAEWWDGTYLYNIGIATGNGLVVLDVDVHPEIGKFGDETLASLEAQYGQLPDTWTCLTGGGGGCTHYYFACNDPALTCATDFLPGLDYRGRGGYVIAPPSLHECGREYEWEAGHTPSDAPLAPLPDWLHTLMLKGREAAPEARIEGNRASPERITEGSRNDTLFRLACSLRGKGMTVEGITAALLAENKARCDPPLPDREVEKIAQSGGKYPPGDLGNQRAGKDEPPKPCLIRACDVPYEPPRWAIAPYFQRGKGTLIQGDNGTGKTAFMCAIAAHVTTGNPLLDIPVAAPGAVVILSVEDDLPILRGRIEASGGDLTECHFMTNAAGLRFTSPEIEAAVKEVNARMIIFDPIQAFMGAKVDMFRPNETRPELAKLFEMCDRNDCACAIISHVGKAGDKSPVNRALGSVDIPAAMRSVMELTINPDDPTECVMVHIKCSNAPKGKSLAYTIGARGGVHWAGFSPMTVEDLTVARKREKNKPVIHYENEPLVQVFNQLVTDKPGGGFWSYAELKRIGAEILGFPPYGDLNDLRQRLDGGLSRELQQRDGLIVTHGATGKRNTRGIRIAKYQQPDGYQTKIPG